MNLWKKNRKKTRQARKRERKHDEKYQQASSTSITFTIASRPSHMLNVCVHSADQIIGNPNNPVLYIFFNRWFTHLTKTSHACDWCYNGNSPYIHFSNRSALCSSQYMNQISHITTMVSCTMHVFTIIKQYSSYMFYDTKNEIEKRKENE